MSPLFSTCRQTSSSVMQRRRRPSSAAEPAIPARALSAYPCAADGQVDVNLPLQIVTLDASIGRIARLRGAPREGPKCVPKPPFGCECKIDFTGTYGELFQRSARATWA